MKNVEFYDIGGAIEPSEILNFERIYKIELPENYKKLLLKYNGGIPIEDVVYVEGQEGSIGGFYSIKKGDVLLENAIRDYQINEKLIPAKFIPIAYDAFGNPYCISTNNDSYGKIFAWYFDTGADEGTLVANSLEEFLGSEI